MGQTCQIPEYRWNGGKNYYENLYFTNAINKYGWNSFSHEIIANELTSEQADKLECELIKKYNTTDPNFGYNIQYGGHGGQTHSEETKRRISESCARVHSGKPRFQLLRKAVLEGSGLMSNDDNIPKG